jgi:hypothetical protein
MKITENTTAQEVWEYHLREKQRFLEPIARNFEITVNEAKEARAEADRLGYALKVAGARIKELEAVVESLRRYEKVVEEALADAAGLNS